MQDNDQTAVQYPLLVSFKAEQLLGQFTLENSQHVIPICEKVKDTFLEENISEELFELFLINALSQKSSIGEIISFPGVKADFLIIMEKLMTTFDVSNQEANKNEIERQIESHHEILKSVNILECDSIVLPFICREGLWNLIIIQNYQKLIKPEILEYLGTKNKFSTSKPQLFYFIFDQMQTSSREQSKMLLGKVENVISCFIKTKYEYSDSSLFIDQRGLNNSNFNYKIIKLCKLRKSSETGMMILKILYDLILGGEKSITAALNTIDFTSYKSETVIKEMISILPTQYKDITSKHKMAKKSQPINNKSLKIEKDKEEISISPKKSEKYLNKNADIDKEKDILMTIETEPGVNESFMKKNRITEVPIDFSKIKTRNTASKLNDPNAYVKMRLSDDKHLVEPNNAERKTFMGIPQTYRDKTIDNFQIYPELDVSSSKTYTKKKKLISRTKEPEILEEYNSKTYSSSKKLLEVIKESPSSGTFTQSGYNANFELKKLHEESNKVENHPIIPIKQKVIPRPPLDLKQEKANAIGKNSKAKIISSSKQVDLHNENVIQTTENTYNESWYLTEESLFFHNQMRKEFTNKGPTVKTKPYKIKVIDIAPDKELFQTIPDQAKQEESQVTCGGCDGICSIF